MKKFKLVTLTEYLLVCIFVAICMIGKVVSPANAFLFVEFADKVKKEIDGVE
jgi:hypothetical protein